MQATTTKDVLAAIVAAVRGTTPRYPALSDQTWHYTPRARDDDLDDGQLRNFYILCGPASYADVHFTEGVPQEMRIEIVTSYRDVPSEDFDAMRNQDNFDLWDTFHGILDPTTPGLFSVEQAGQSIDYGDDDDARVAHLFTVVYNQQL